MTSRLFLCEGYCPLTGTIREVVWATGYGAAKTKFFRQHGIKATHISIEK